MLCVIVLIIYARCLLQGFYCRHYLCYVSTTITSCLYIICFTFAILRRFCLPLTELSQAVQCLCRGKYWWCWYQLVQLITDDWLRWTTYDGADPGDKWLWNTAHWTMAATRATGILVIRIFTSLRKINEISLRYNNVEWWVGQNITLVDGLCNFMLDRWRVNRCNEGDIKEPNYKRWLDYNTEGFTWQEL